MRYEVVWDPLCYSHIEAILAIGVPAGHLKQIAKSIAEQLAILPHTLGIELWEELRRIDAGSVRVYFHIDDANATVVVDAIGWVSSTR
jgi:hypothetical protein